MLSTRTRRQSSFFSCLRVPILLVALVLSSGTDLRAQVEVVAVAVDGLACPFCAFGLEKRIKKVPGVAKVEVDVAGGRAEVSATRGESVDFASIPGAVGKAGFTAGKLQLTVVGTLKPGEEGGLRLQVPGSKNDLRIVGSTPEVESDLEALLGGGVRVRLTGTVHLKEGELPKLVTQSISIVK